MIQKLPKTRIIPISDFYTRLQLEYLSYKFRSMIYHRPFDKKKFEEICNKKKEKINQIALENSLPSIFNNVEQQKKYLFRFFGKGGIPAFCYRDDYQTSVKGHWDLFYYFIPGASVKLQLHEDIEIGRIVCNDIEVQKLSVEINGKTISAIYQDVTRIFPSNFYQDLFK
jgi:hypothetical protein